MTCEDCTTAAARAWYGYRSGCIGCNARAISRGPDFDRCRRAAKQDAAYRQALERVGITHKQAVEAYQVDRMNRKDAA